MNPVVPNIPVPIMFETIRQAAVKAVTLPANGFAGPLDAESVPGDPATAASVVLATRAIRLA